MIERRTPIARSTKPLKRTSIARSTKPIPRMSTKRKRTSDRQWQKAKRFVHGRSGGRCEACQTHRLDACNGRGEHVHHVILRSRGGPDEEWNLLDVSETHHAWIHDNPAAATAAGLMRSLTT